MRLLGGWHNPVPDKESIDGGMSKMTKSTVSSSARRSSDSSSRHRSKSSSSRQPHSSKRSTISSPRDSSRTVRSSTSRSSASRGRSVERESHHSNSSRRSTSSPRHPSRSRAQSLDVSESSSRGRSRTTSEDRLSSRRRSSSQSSRRSTSHSRSASASRGSSSRDRSYSNSKPPLTLPPREAYGLTRQDTAHVSSGGASRHTSSTPRSSSSRGRGGRSSDRSGASTASRKSSSSKSKFGFRGKSVTSPKSVSSGSRSSSGRRSHRNDKSSRSQPLLDGSAYDYDEKRGPQDLSAIESDLEYGTVGDQFTVTTFGYPYGGERQSTPLTNPEQMVNGLLIQLKFESEVCPWPLRLMLVLVALGMLATSLAPYFLGYALSVADVIISTLTACLSILIVLLEGRFSLVSNDPGGCRASVRGNIVKSIGGLKLVWGRGVLYVITGLLQVAQMHTITYITGGLMTLVGLVVIVAGASSAAQLMRLKKSLTDDAHLLYLFAKYDSNKDGYQVIKDFARFIVSVGLDLDDAYTIGAFKAIDKDHDGKISFIDFHKWWAQCTVQGNHVFRMKEQEINNISKGVGSW